ncbi:SprT family zinc-dependent metalloprotease [Pleomorphovibrio marinus]|uniref:transcription elongation protein SprT n=1 Tax=Pleomorphovibrio marinus TaxID=2164132 RepID=UPI000E0C9369|nr:transcription elongation protein SprT [Pleomorphovibrio marinus]
MNKEIFTGALRGRVPESSLDYCYEVWKADPFRLHITSSRSTKLGDFSFQRSRSLQRISINHDLNIYQFLITYLHEVAHHRVYSKYGMGKKPHGVEWKLAFRSVMAPVLTGKVFPLDVLIPLKRHMTNPKASAGADFFLAKELKKYDTVKPGVDLVFLGDVKVGSAFEIKARVFKKLETRRTRVLCQELSNGKKYLISSHAEVALVDAP